MTQTCISPETMNTQPQAHETTLNVQVISKVQTKTPVRCNFTSWAVERLWPFHNLLTWEKRKTVQTQGKKMISSKNKHKVTYEPAVLLSYISKI